MSRLAVVLLISWLVTACDPEGRKKCDWVLEPEPNLLGTSTPGYIPVCARNRTTMKQDCRMQATLEFAKTASGKKFRYVDLRLDKASVPRTVMNIKFCK